MMNYEVRVTSKGEFIWGAESFNTDIVNESQAELVIRNSEHGEDIKLYKEPNVGGSGGLFAQLAPGGTVNFSLKGCTGIKAVCGTDQADSQIQCFIMLPYNR